MLNRTPISERAKGRWRDILIALGVDKTYLTGKHGPCPICNDGKDRFRWDDKDGKGTYYCNVHGSGDGVKLLQELKGWDFKQTAQEIERVIGDCAVQQPKPPRDEEKAKEYMRRIWSESRPVEAGDPVTLYLKNRGIEWTPEITNLRFCERLGYRDQDGPTSYHPAMLAVIMDPNGVPASLHRTYITRYGKKAPVPVARKTMPIAIPQGSAVRLGAHGTILGVAEGIETALAAHVHHRVNIPVWSVLNATLMASWEPPEGVTDVVIYSDNDSNFTGQASAYVLAKRLAVRRGLRVNVRIPSVADTDWNDVLMKRHPRMGERS